MAEKFWKSYKTKSLRWLRRNYFSKLTLILTIFLEFWEIFKNSNSEYAKYNLLFFFKLWLKFFKKICTFKMLANLGNIKKFQWLLQLIGNFFQSTTMKIQLWLETKFFDWNLTNLEFLTKLIFPIQCSANPSW